jgi:diacylglycerol kinase (ATP)
MQAALPRVRAALEERTVTVCITESADDSLRVARVAFGRNEGVIACGGDGTISPLAALAAEAHGALAIVPAGSGNDFARQLRIPRDSVEAVRLLDTGKLVVVDLGTVRTGDGTETTFTTVAGAGFDAEVNRWANTVHWASGTMLYVLATLRTLVRYRPLPFRVRVDEQEWEGDAWFVAVGNTRSYGGGMAITPAAVIDDGALDVCIVTAVSRVELLAKFARVFRGTHVGDGAALTFRGTAITIESPGAPAPMDLWASGERIGPLPADLRALPGALRVLAPADARLPSADD